MEKFFIFNLVLLAAMVTSCNTNDWPEAIGQDKMEEMAENPYAMGGDEAMERALAFINRDKVSLRSGKVDLLDDAVVKAEGYKVKVNRLSAGKEVKQEIPVYTVNYRDKAGKSAGFAVVAGDSRIPDNILIFSDGDGAAFDMEERVDAEFLKDRISGYLFHQINKEKPVATRAKIITDYGNGYKYVVPCICLGQEYDPYKRYTPFRYGWRSVPGCVAVAMSEIMISNRWPLQGKFKRYTTDTSTPDIVTVSYDLTDAQWNHAMSSNMLWCEQFDPDVPEYVANMLVETGYRLNSHYAGDWTSALTKNVPAVFSAMGYTTGNKQAYNFDAIKTDIEEEELLVYMAGNPQTSYLSGHAYVITGTYYPPGGSRYLIVNHGFAEPNGVSAYQDPVTGYWQTHFNEAMFSADTTSSYVPSGLDMIYPYRFECEIVNNIRPNKSKNGCMDANWRVSSTYPY